MALPKHAFEAFHAESESTSLVLFQRQQVFDSNDVLALICDFFSCFEEEWKQPVKQTSGPDRDNLLSQVLVFPHLDEEELYSISALASLVRYNPGYVGIALKKAGIRPVKMHSGIHGGGSTPNLYLGGNCKKLVEKWI